MLTLRLSATWEFLSAFPLCWSRINNTSQRHHSSLHLTTEFEWIWNQINKTTRVHKNERGENRCMLKQFPSLQPQTGRTPEFNVPAPKCPQATWAPISRVRKNTHKLFYGAHMHLSSQFGLFHEGLFRTNYSSSGNAGNRLHNEHPSTNKSDILGTMCSRVAQ